jgi:hypothetical protein
MPNISRSHGLQTLLKDLIASLSLLTCVRQIDTFGSIAVGTWDPWSDIDLLVSCDMPEQTAWLASAIIRSTRPVAFYRMFTGVPQPSGRYWFGGESPFHRLDVSFHSGADDAAACGGGVRCGFPINVRTEYIATNPSEPDTDTSRFARATPVKITDADGHTGRLLYLYLKAAKLECRNQQPQQGAQEIRAALLENRAQSTMMSESVELVTFIATVDVFIQKMLHC